jgi:L-ribulokinase
MGKNRLSLGIDFGSNAARALIIDVDTGIEIGTSSSDYPGGEKGIFTEPGNPHLARQCPGSYLHAMTVAVKGAIENASQNENFNVENIIGIGVDATASTPLPVDENMTPLSFKDEFKNNLNAKAWMWKDHTSMAEAEKITALAAEIRPQYLAKCGGTYSSEWFFSKIWHCMNIDQEVFNAAYTWLDFPDFVPAVLAGIKNPDDVKRGVCGAGHKALYSEEWGGLPDSEFFDKLDPRLAEFLPRLFSKACSGDEIAGNLCKERAEMLGLPEGIPISIGFIDAHLGAVGAGVGKGKLARIIGTSSCDIMTVPSEHKLPDIPGVCGIVDGSVIPGYYGIEAGQSAVGDIFNWFVTKVCDSDHDIFSKLTEEATNLKPGQSGLLALDWNNGNRCTLANPKLSGLLIGQTLHTSQAEIYRALLEGTAFGAKKIIDRLEEYGVHIEEIINCGGIAEKNSLFMQICADIFNRPLKISASSETCALGAAIYGAVVGGAYEKIEDAQEKICSFKDTEYHPIEQNVKVYKELYSLYSELYESFGVKGSSFDHSGIMEKLFEIKSKTSK